MEWVHVYPVNDLIEHNTDNDGLSDFVCQCDPKIDLDGIITHNSMDRREVYEKE